MGEPGLPMNLISHPLGLRLDIVFSSTENKNYPDNIHSKV